VLARVVRWALERPRLIAWACVWFLAWGVFFMRDAKVELMPDLAPAETRIQTEAPGLVAEQVETFVTQPLESVLIGAPGVAHVRSESTQGLSTIVVRFAEGADPRRVRQALSENLAAEAGSLPQGVGPPRLAPLAAPGPDVLKLGFTSARLDPMALRDVVQWTLRPRLLSVPGVARVAVYGGQTRRIEVRARPGDLADSDLGFLDILNAVRRATSITGAGFIDTEGQRVLIEPHGQALTVDDVGAGQIQTPGSTPVRIADVTDVVEAPAPAFGDALIDGKPGVLVEIARQEGANPLETTHAVEEAMAVLHPTLAAEGVEVATLDRPASFTSRAMRAIAVDLLFGAALIALVLALFLRDWRAVVVSLVSIPLSFVASVVALKALGVTLNAMTLGGLAVGLGVVIDDAVIGVENVMARVRAAEHAHSSDLEAVLAGTLDVRGPVIYATLAAVAVIAPLLALRGVQGALLQPMAAAVITVSLASLAVAAVVTPALGLLLHHHDDPPPEPAALSRLKAAHAGLLTRLCANARFATLLAGATVVLVVGALVFCRSDLLPSIRDGHLVAQITAPASTSLAAMDDYGARIGAELKALPGVTRVAQRIGRDPTDDNADGPERALFDLDLAPGLGAAAQRRLADRVLDDLRLHPGLEPLVRTRFDAGQASSGEDAAAQIRVVGQNLDALDAAADRIAAAVAPLPGARDVQVQDLARAPVVRVDLNFPRLALYGLSSADVLDTVQAAFAGERVAQIYEDGRIVDLAVSAQTSLRRDPEAVGDLLLRSTSGFSEPLKTVANVYLADGRAAIAHDDGLRRQVILVDPADPDRFLREARRAVQAGVKLPPGAFVEYASGSAAVGQAQRDMIVSYAFVVFAILALLAIAYDARTAALIMAASLFSFVGGAVAVFLMGGVLTVGATVGFVALFGLSMRNGILLFSRLEEVILGREAPWSGPTVVGVTRERLTPLLMTSLLVALALSPFAVQSGEAGRELVGPMAIVILGGLVAGVLGALFVLPAMILAFWRPAYARRARRHGPAAG